MFRIDLHTHSVASPDGGLRLADYRRVLQAGTLDYIAITDHDQIAAAQHIKQQLGELGDRIIIGEEISTPAGDIIGLYLSDVVQAGLSPREAAERIKQQGGLVYVPHPFETVRSGMATEALDSIADLVDIVEVYNGRAVFQDRGRDAGQWAALHHTSCAASSDAHGAIGWGKTYSVIAAAPTVGTLPVLLVDATRVTQRVGLGIVYPKLNRIAKLFGGRA